MNDYDKPETAYCHGLVINDGREFINWGSSRRTRPAVYAEPLSYADVQAIVRDAGRFPTPVHPVGAMLSVSSTLVNDGGTLLCTRKLDAIIGFEFCPDGRQAVRVQAGCRLKKLHAWLGLRGFEIPFMAEIGEATVGSVAVGDTKESSLDGPGYFSAHVLEIVYADETGAICTLSERDDPAAFYEFKCSFGLSGIVLECLVEVRPSMLCRADVSVDVFPSPEELASGVLRIRESCDAVLAIVVLHQLAVIAERRYKVADGTLPSPDAREVCEAYRLAKRLAIQRGFDGVEVPQPQGIVFSRHDFVNEYWRPKATEPRLDFQYYEHDIAMLPKVIEEAYRFTVEFQKETGFAPNGWATYFVKRPEREQKPFGLYSAGPGWSCSFDPLCANPCDPKWQRFAEEYNQLAIRELGGQASPIQTQWLRHGDVMIPRRLAKARFTTDYYAQFLV